MCLHSSKMIKVFPKYIGVGRVVRWCWVNFQCWGVLPILIIVGHGPTALTVGARGGCSDIFTLVYHLLSPSLWETARYRLKYSLKGPLSPKTTYEGISKSFEPNMERARNLDLFCFIFQRSPLPTPHTCPI